MPSPNPSSQPILISCRTCAHATFMQWFENPVIAQCAMFGDRQVADSMRRCKQYHYRDNSDRPVQHFDSYEEQP